MIGIVSYGLGNISAFSNIYKSLDIPYKIISSKDELMGVKKIILPGVGAFKDGMKHLEELGLIELLNKEVISNKKPFLGICLGMQLLGKKSYENGETKGLGWIDAEVIKFDFSEEEIKLKIPHVGWNNTSYENKNDLYENVLNNSDFYFVHSYHFETKENVTTSVTDYGIKFVSSIQKNNIYAFQFHPEKSQESGLEILKNFANLEFGV